MMRFRSLCFLMLLLLPACADNPASLQMVTAESLVTPTVTMVPTETAVLPASEATIEPALTLSVWLPESIAPTNNQAAKLVLASQVDNFQASESGLTVSLRLKKESGTGGLMATLLSASDVALGALPDLTLIHREDLRTAVQAGLAQPLEGRLSSAVMADFYSAAVQLGQINGRLYGLAYALEIEHVAYQSPSADYAHFDSVLSGGRPLVVPVGQATGISDVFLVQYLAAGGSVVGNHLGALNVEALRTVLNFYEQAIDAGVIDPGVLNYPTPQDYQAGLVDGRITAAVVTSSMYLDLLTAGKKLEIAPIPTSSDTPSTLVDGWMWIMTAKDASRQDAARRFLEWVFDPGRQGAYTHAIAMLPSTKAAMRGWGTISYGDFAGDLLANAVLPLDNTESDSTARALQNALVAVISGERTAADAVQDVVDQLAG
ncbi:MAG: extracellular solute-binding protein [Chloroflexota bacterium]